MKCHEEQQIGEQRIKKAIGVCLRNRKEGKIAKYTKTIIFVEAI